MCWHRKPILPSSLTVSAAAVSSLVQKGQRPFAEAASLLPEVRFAFVGTWEDDAVEELRSIAGENVIFTGRLPDDDLRDSYRRAAVYVQASRHEGFGLAVAEAMLAGCVPVATSATRREERLRFAGPDWSGSSARGCTRTTWWSGNFPATQT